MFTNLAPQKMKTGWWFGTCFIFPYIGNNDPNWRTPSFFRGVGWNHQHPPTREYRTQEVAAEFSIQDKSGKMHVTTSIDAPAPWHDTKKGISGFRVVEVPQWFAQKMEVSPKMDGLYSL